jgi:hypothetical protein
MFSFKPASFLKNPHTQTILGASKLRLELVHLRTKDVRKHSESILLRAEEGVRLHADFAKNPNSNNKLAILLHGWEGSSNSAYILSCAQSLFNMGYNIARLNLRDHGDTHHLNQTPFNSVRIDEVCEAILNLSLRHPNEGILLLGFSLGGNFVLRLSGLAKIQALNIENTIAICPAIDPLNTSRALEKSGSWFYHHHFLKKWRASLLKKYRYYPEIMRSTNDLKVKRLHKMNEFFAPLHTGFENAEEYLSAYTITQSTLNAIHNNCAIIYSDDDPIIKASDYDVLEPNKFVEFHPQTHGGHCAFLQDAQLTSWVASILPAIIQSTQK